MPGAFRRDKARHHILQESSATNLEHGDEILVGPVGMQYLVVE